MSYISGSEVNVFCHFVLFCSATLGERAVLILLQDHSQQCLGDHVMLGIKLRPPEWQASLIGAQSNQLFLQSYILHYSKLFVERKHNCSMLLQFSPAVSRAYHKQGKCFTSCSSILRRCLGKKSIDFKKGKRKYSDGGVSQQREEFLVIGATYLAENSKKIIKKNYLRSEREWVRYRESVGGKGNFI